MHSTWLLTSGPIINWLSFSRILQCLKKNLVVSESNMFAISSITSLVGCNGCCKKVEVNKKTMCEWRTGNWCMCVCVRVLCWETKSHLFHLKSWNIALANPVHKNVEAVVWMNECMNLCMCVCVRAFTFSKSSWPWNTPSFEWHWHRHVYSILRRYIWKPDGGSRAVGREWMGR